MARDFFIHGENLVRVKSRSDSAIATLTELGLSADPITVTIDIQHLPAQVDAAGGRIPPELQVMLGQCMVTINFIHIDRAVLDECLRLSMGYPAAIGQVARAGARLGNNVARFAPGYNFVGLNMTSPVALKPWRFLHTYMTGPALSHNVGTEKSIFRTQWMATLYDRDIYNAGLGMQNQVLWDHTNDS